MTKIIVKVKSHEFLETYLQTLVDKNIDDLSPAQLRTLTKLMLKKYGLLSKDNTILSQ